MRDFMLYAYTCQAQIVLKLLQGNMSAWNITLPILWQILVKINWNKD